MKILFQHVMLLELLLLLTIIGRDNLAVVAANENELVVHSTNPVATATNVTILGLGGMGVAVVKCLSSSSSSSQDDSIIQQVHAWNRGRMKREQVINLNLPNVHVHDTIINAIESSDVILTMIDDWDGTIQLIQDSIIHSKNTINTTTTDEKLQMKKTFVLFSTYTPLDITKFQNDFSVSNIRLIGGAIVGVPQTICSPNAFILSSCGTEFTNERGVPLQTIQHTLDALGTHVSFYNQDIGLAPLANIALIQSITFGIVGHEMSQLLFQQYAGTTNEFVQSYNEHALKIIPTYISMLLPLVSNRVKYVPAKTFLNVMKLHMNFFIELGIAHDTYLAGYIKYLQSVEDSSEDGPASWIKYAKTESKQPILDEL